MAEALLGHEPLVGHWDPVGRLATVRGWSAGPSGTAGLELGGGMELDIDIAEPARVVELALELPSTGVIGSLTVRQRRGLDALLGRERAAEFMVLGREASTDLPAPPPRGLDGADLYASQPRAQVRDDLDARRRRRVPDAGVAPALYRTALAHVAAGGPAVRPLVRAVGLLEAAVALDTISSSIDVGAIRRHDTRVGTELLLDVMADGVLVVPDSRAALELAALLRRVRHQLDEQPLAAARLVALARDLDRGDHVAGLRQPPRSARAGRTGFAAPRGGRRDDIDRLDHDRAGLPVAAVASHPKSELGSLAKLGDVRRVALDVRSLAGALTEAELSAMRRAPSEVEVRVDGWSDRCAALWARAFHASDDCLIAVAPFLGVGDDAVARLLVPPDATDRLEVDLTDRPEMPRSSPSLAAAQRAMHAGRMAAQAERLNQLDDAATWWRLCARNWDTADDTDRAARARTYAGQARPRDLDRTERAIAPLVTDLVGRDG